jgi:phage baseplate assembly protein V
MSKELHALARKLRLLFGLGLVRQSDDTKRLQRMQVSLLADEVRDDCNRYQNYGFASRPLPGAEALLAAVGGARNHVVVVVVDDGRYRKRDLQPGESAMYTDEGDYIYLQRGRIIEVQAGTKLKIDTPAAEFTGYVDVTEHVKVAGVKVVGSQGAAVADAAGGAVVDSQARAAINTLLARLRSHGLIES